MLVVSVRRGRCKHCEETDRAFYRKAGAAHQFQPTKDGYIDKCQEIIKNPFPALGGLNCCTVGATLEFHKANGKICK